MLEVVGITPRKIRIYSLYVGYGFDRFFDTGGFYVEAFDIPVIDYIYYYQDAFDD